MIQYSLFLTCGKEREKKNYQVCRSYYKVFLLIFLHTVLLNFGHSWATDVRQVLVWTGPSCPNAHSRQIWSLPSAGWTVYFCLHSLSHRCHLAWLPLFRCLAWDSGYTYAHKLLQNGLWYVHRKTNGMHFCTINHINHTAGMGWSDLLSWPLLSGTVPNATLWALHCIGL